MVDIVCGLIHGTFAPNSEWKNEDSSFRNFLELELGRAGKSVEFVELDWDGSNTSSSRDNAANDLFNKVENHPNKNIKNSDIYLFAHSHGGNIALNTSKVHSKRKSIKGIVCYNTPFTYSWKRDFIGNYEFFNKIIYFLLLFIPLIIFVYITNSFVKEIMDGNNFIYKIAFYLAVSLSILLFVIITTYTFRYLSVRIIKYLKYRKLLCYRGEAVDDKYDTRLLLFNSGGDEVYNLLGFFAFLVNIPFFLMHKIVLSVLTVMSISFFFLNLDARNVGGQCGDQELRSWNYLTDLFSSFAIEFGCVFFVSSADSAYSQLMNILVSIAFGGLQLCALIVVMLLFGLITNWMYCWIGLGIRNSKNHWASYIFLRRGVAMVPYDAKFIEFVDVEKGSSFLNHSAIYNDQDVIRRSSQWILSNLEGR